MLNDAQSVLLERDAAHLIHPLHLPAGHAGGKVWVGGEGEFLIDANGDRYIDGLSGLWNNTAGNGRRELAEAGYKQMLEMGFASGYTGSSNPRAIELAERLAALGQLSAGLAHEIRNPLGSIRGSIELLRTGTSLHSEDQRLCEIIERETMRLNDLVADMLDFSRPRTPELANIDLVSTARSVVKLANSSGRGADVDVHILEFQELFAFVPGEEVGRG